MKYGENVITKTGVYDDAPRSCNKNIFMKYVMNIYFTIMRYPYVRNNVIIQTVKTT